MPRKKPKRGPGQPPKGRHALTTNFIFKVSEALLERIEAAAARLGVSPRVMVRRIVKDWLRRPRKLPD